MLSSFAVLTSLSSILPAISVNGSSYTALYSQFSYRKQLNDKNGYVANTKFLFHSEALNKEILRTLPTLISSSFQEQHMSPKTY